MKLTAQIFKIFSLIFIAQLIAVGIWAFYLYSSEKNGFPLSVVNSLTRVDKSILEGIVLQNKMGNTSSRDLVAYKLLELNNVDSAAFVKAKTLSEIVSDFNLKNCRNESDVNICFKEGSNVALSLIPLKLGDSLQGYLKLEKSLKSFDEINRKVLYTIGITLLVVFLINIFGLITLWWKFLKPETERLLRSFDNQTEDPLIRIAEYKLVQDKFLDAIRKIKASESTQLALVTELQKVNLATQVAHDIRSPLEMLKGLKDELSSLPESSRRRVQLGINRIEEITFNLLKDHKVSSKRNMSHKSEELLSILEGILTEKSIEFRNLEKILLEQLFNSHSYGLFSLIDRGILKSIISNLMNNSVEAFEGNAGRVGLRLFSMENQNLIEILDNGPGIADEIAKKLFTKGFTTKMNGNGLGLYNAKLDLEAVGGSITFTTELGKGTTFTITLPKSEAPLTFIDAIHAYKYERIIVLDDDPAFHEVWAKRLDGLESKLEHIYSVKEMLSKYQALHPKILLLSDFELMDKKFDGIDVILMLNHAHNSVLVTARSEEQAIQERCLDNDLKLLPKSLVNYIKVFKELSESSHAQLEPACMVGDELAVGSAGEKYGVYIEGGQARSDAPVFPRQSKLDQVEGSQDSNASGSEMLKSVFIEGVQGVRTEACKSHVAGMEVRSDDELERQNLTSPIILIDDDKLVHINWRMYCEKNGFSFHGFKSIAEFLKVAQTFDKSTRIYIDSNLGDGIKGEIESEKIYLLGFLNLYIATGYEKRDIDKPAWIKEVYSKSPESISQMEKFP